MAQMDPKQGLARSKKAWDEKQLSAGLLSDALSMTMPEKDSSRHQTQGQLHNDLIYANTLQQSHTKFANFMQSELTPPMQKWMQLVVGPRVPEPAREGVKRELQKLREVFFAMVQSSNFDTAAHEHYLELGLMTAATLTLPSDEPGRDVMYVTAPQTQYAIEVGAWGNTNALFRKFSLPRRDVQAQWRDAFEGPTTSKPVNWGADLRDSPDKKVDIEEMVYWDFPDDPNLWYYEVLIKEHGTQSSEVSRIVSRELTENPWTISRWSKSAGETYGRGPVLLALADAKVQNIIYKLLLMNASLSVKGIYTGVDDGIFNPRTVKLVPGAIIPVASNGGGNAGRTLEPLQPSTNMDLSMFILDDMDSRIKRAMLDEGLPPDTSAVRSATEIAKRIKDSANATASPYGRLHQEWIRPIVQKTINVGLRTGISGFERLAHSGIRLDGNLMDVKVTSDLAKSQALSELDGYVRMVELSNALFGPENTQMGVKTSESIPFMAERLGVDPNQLRDTKERMLFQAQQMVAAQRAAIEANKNGDQPEVPIGQQAVA